MTTTPSGARVGRPLGPDSCSLPDCSKPGPTIRGLCVRHYKAAWKRGEFGNRDVFTHRICDTCMVDKPIAEYQASAKHLVTQETCRDCRRKQQEPGKYRQQRDWQLRRAYGITLERYEAMMVAQGHVCAICRRPPGERAFHVDHDHGTGAVRGILCASCNQGLGVFRDDTAALLRAVDYLLATGDVLASLTVERRP